MPKVSTGKWTPDLNSAVPPSAFSPGGCWVQKGLEGTPLCFMFLEQQSTGNGVRQRRRETPGPECRPSSLPDHEEQDRKKPLLAVSQEHAKEPKCSPGWPGRAGWEGQGHSTPLPQTASSSRVFQRKSASWRLHSHGKLCDLPGWKALSVHGAFEACGLETIDPCP